MHRTRVKICGITRPVDGQIAARLGADAIGLVFYPPSPRCVTIETARQIVAGLPPFISVVGLFVNPDPAAVRAVLAAVPLQLLQFHGDESPEDCAAFDRPYIKAVPMGAQADIRAYAQQFSTAAGLLLDSHGGVHTGGSGQPFDWAVIPTQRTMPLVLAGGLHPNNVASAIQQVRPDAVDVSSGVESAKGIKDPARIRAFLEGVSEGDCHVSAST